MQDLMKKLLEIAHEILGRWVELEQDKQEIPEWDSFAHLMLINRVEEEFGIAIPIEDTANIRKLSDFLQYISK